MIALGLLRGIDQLPAFVDGDGRGDLDEGVLAALHGLDGHRHVPFPRRGDVDDVDVVAGHHLLPGILGVGVDDRLLAGLRLHVVEGALGAFGLEVADRHDFSEVDVHGRVHVRHAAREADEGAADFLQGLGLEVPDRLVAGGARARRGDVLRVQQFQGLGIRSRFRGGEGAEAKADASEGAELQEITTGVLFGEAHGGAFQDSRGPPWLQCLA